MSCEVTWDDASKSSVRSKLQEESLQHFPSEITGTTTDRTQSMKTWSSHSTPIKESCS